MRSKEFKKSDVGVNRSSKFKPMVGFITAVAFLFNTLVYDTGWAVPVRSVSHQIPEISDINNNFADGTLSHIGAFTLPASLGEIKSREHFPDSSYTIFHIQDAHANYDCQKSIAGIISHIEKEYGVKTVNLEGGSGEYDLSVFTRIKDAGIRRRVADYFVREGILNGAEYLYVNDPGSTYLWGIEDVDLYISNLEAYRGSLRHSDSIDSALRSLSENLDRIKKAVYSAELYEIDSRFAAYRRGDVELRDHLTFLSSKSQSEGLHLKAYPNLYLLAHSLELEHEIDFRAANTQRSILIDELGRLIPISMLEILTVKTIEFRSGNISQTEFYEFLGFLARRVGLSISDFPQLEKFMIYVSLYDAVDKSAVISEISNLEEAIKECFYENETQKELGVYSKNMTVLENMFAIKLTREDYEYYRLNEDDLSVENFTAFIKRETPAGLMEIRLAAEIAELDERRAEISKFYEYSFKRDHVFLENIKFDSLKKDDNRKYAMLVTGGFHSENLYDLFREKRISYVSVMPGFRNKDTYENPYFRLLSGHHAGVMAKLSESSDALSSALALYSYFCETSGLVKGQKRVEAASVWVELVTAVFSRSYRQMDEIIEIKDPGGTVMYTVERAEFSVPKSLAKNQTIVSVDGFDVLVTRIEDDRTLTLETEDKTSFAGSDSGMAPLPSLWGIGMLSSVSISILVGALLFPFLSWWTVLPASLILFSGISMSLTGKLSVSGKVITAADVSDDVGISLDDVSEQTHADEYFPPVVKAQRPIVDLSIDPIKAEEWINAQITDEHKNFAEFVVRNIRYVGQENFEKKLKRTIDSLNEQLRGRPFSAAVLGRTPEDVSGKVKSNAWTYQLAREHGLREPETLIFETGTDITGWEIAEKIIEYLKKNDEINDIVYVDDAAYSGSQLIRWLSQFQHLFNESGDLMKRKIRVHIAMPFMTDKVKKSLEKMRTLRFGVDIHHHENIPTVGQILDTIKEPPAREKIMEVLREKFEQKALDQTLFYMQHKRPDFISMLSTHTDCITVVEGPILGLDDNKSVELIPPGDLSPYHQDYFENVKKLIGGFWEKRIISNVPDMSNVISHTLYNFAALHTDSSEGFPLDTGKGDKGIELSLAVSPEEYKDFQARPVALVGYVSSVSARPSAVMPEEVAKVNTKDTNGRPVVINFKPWTIYEFDIDSGLTGSIAAFALREQERFDVHRQAWLDMSSEERKALAAGWKSINDETWPGPPRVLLVHEDKVSGLDPMVTEIENGFLLGDNSFAVYGDRSRVEFENNMRGLADGIDGEQYVRISAASLARITVNIEGEKYYIFQGKEGMLTEKGTARYQPFGGHAYFSPETREELFKRFDIITETKNDPEHMAFYIKRSRLDEFMVLYNQERMSGNWHYFMNAEDALRRELREELGGVDTEGNIAPDGISVISPPFFGIPSPREDKITAGADIRPVSYVWKKMFEKNNVPMDGTVIEVAPGHRTKVGDGLAMLGFKGTIIIVEPDGSAAREVMRAYRKRMPEATVRIAVKPLEDLEPGVDFPGKVDALVANHPFDDMVVADAINMAENTDLSSQRSAEESWDLTADGLNELEDMDITYDERYGHSIKRVIDAWKDAFRKIQPGHFIASQYLSRTLSNRGSHLRQNSGYIVMDQLRKDFQEKHGEMITDGQVGSLSDPVWWISLSRPHMDLSDNLAMRPGALKRLGDRTFVLHKARRLKPEEYEVVLADPDHFARYGGDPMKLAESFAVVIDNERPDDADTVYVYVDCQSDKTGIALGKGRKAVTLAGNMHDSGSGRAAYFGKNYNIVGIGRTVFAGEDPIHSNGKDSLVFSLRRAIISKWVNFFGSRAPSHPVVIAMNELGDYSKSPFPLPHPVPFSLLVREDDGILDRPSHVEYNPSIEFDFEKTLREYARIDAEYLAYRMMLGAWSTGNYSLDGRIIDVESISFVRHRSPYSVVSTKYKDTFFGYERFGILKVLRQLAEAKGITDIEIEKRFNEERMDHLARCLLELIGVEGSSTGAVFNTYKDKIIDLAGMFEELSKKISPRKVSLDVFNSPVLEDDDPCMLDMSMFFRELANLYYSPDITREDAAYDLLKRKGPFADAASGMSYEPDIILSGKGAGKLNEAQVFLRDNAVITADKLDEFKKSTRKFIEDMFGLIDILHSEGVFPDRSDWHERLQVMNQDLPYTADLNHVLIDLVEQYRLGKIDALKLGEEVKKLSSLPYFSDGGHPGAVEQRRSASRLMQLMKAESPDNLSPAYPGEGTEARETGEMSDALVEKFLSGGIRTVSVLGRPGAGKGTLSDHLVDRINEALRDRDPGGGRFEKLTVGDYFRGIDRIVKGKASDNDKKIYEKFLPLVPKDDLERMSQGYMMSDDTVISVINAVLQEERYQKAYGILFDGFERDLHQFEAVKQGKILWKGDTTGMDLRIVVDAPEDVLLGRIIDRAAADLRRGIHRPDAPVSSDGTVDKIAAERILLKRLEDYNSSTALLVDEIGSDEKTIIVRGYARGKDGSVLKDWQEEAAVRETFFLQLDTWLEDLKEKVEDTAAKDAKLRMLMNARPGYQRTFYHVPVGGTDNVDHKGAPTVRVFEVFEYEFLESEAGHIFENIRSGESPHILLLREQYLPDLPETSRQIVLSDEMGIIPRSLKGKKVNLGDNLYFIRGDASSPGEDEIISQTSSVPGSIRISPSSLIRFKIPDGEGGWLYLVSVNRNRLRGGEKTITPFGGGYRFAGKTGQDMYRAEGVEMATAKPKEPNTMVQFIGSDKLSAFLRLFNSGRGREVSPLREIVEEGVEEDLFFKGEEPFAIQRASSRFMNEWDISAVPLADEDYSFLRGSVKHMKEAASDEERLKTLLELRFKRGIDTVSIMQEIQEYDMPSIIEMMSMVSLFSLSDTVLQTLAAVSPNEAKMALELFEKYPEHRQAALEEDRASHLNRLDGASSGFAMLRDPAGIAIMAIAGLFIFSIAVLSPFIAGWTLAGIETGIFSPIIFKVFEFMPGFLDEPLWQSIGLTAGLVSGGLKAVEEPLKEPRVHSKPLTTIIRDLAIGTDKKSGITFGYDLSGRPVKGRFLRMDEYSDVIFEFNKYPFIPFFKSEGRMSREAYLLFNRYSEQGSILVGGKEYRLRNIRYDSDFYSQGGSGIAGMSLAQLLNYLIISEEGGWCAWDNFPGMVMFHMVKDGNLVTYDYSARESSSGHGVKWFLSRSETDGSYIQEKEVPGYLVWNVKELVSMGPEGVESFFDLYLSTEIKDRNLIRSMVKVVNGYQDEAELKKAMIRTKSEKEGMLKPDLVKEYLDAREEYSRAENKAQKVRTSFYRARSFLAELMDSPQTTQEYDMYFGPHSESSINRLAGAEEKLRRYVRQVGAGEDLTVTLKSPTSHEIFDGDIISFGHRVKADGEKGFLIKNVDGKFYLMSQDKDREGYLQGYVLKENNRIGRQLGRNDIVISDPRISRREHATITVEDGRIFIADNSSLNGTFVNGERIPSAAKDKGFRGHVPRNIKILAGAFSAYVFSGLSAAADVLEASAIRSDEILTGFFANLPWSSIVLLGGGIIWCGSIIAVSFLSGSRDEGMMEGRRRFSMIAVGSVFVFVTSRIFTKFRAASRGTAQEIAKELLSRKNIDRDSFEKMRNEFPHISEVFEKVGYHDFTSHHISEKEIDLLAGIIEYGRNKYPEMFHRFLAAVDHVIFVEDGPHKRDMGYGLLSNGSIVFEFEGKIPDLDEDNIKDYSQLFIHEAAHIEGKDEHIGIYSEIYAREIGLEWDEFVRDMPQSWRNEEAYMIDVLNSAIKKTGKGVNVSRNDIEDSEAGLVWDHYWANGVSEMEATRLMGMAQQCLFIEGYSEEDVAYLRGEILPGALKNDGGDEVRGYWLTFQVGAEKKQVFAGVDDKGDGHVIYENEWKKFFVKHEVVKTVGPVFAPETGLLAASHESRDKKIPMPTTTESDRVSGIVGAMHEDESKKGLFEQVQTWMNELEVSEWNEAVKFIMSQQTNEDRESIDSALQRIKRITDLPDETIHKMKEKMLLMDIAPIQDTKGGRIGGLLLRHEGELKMLFPRYALEDLDDIELLGDLYHEIIEMEFIESGMSPKDAHQRAMTARRHFISRAEAQTGIVGAMHEDEKGMQYSMANISMPVVIKMKEIFGEGVVDWLERYGGKGDRFLLDICSGKMADDEDFRETLRRPGVESSVEIIRYAVSNSMPLGTKNLVKFTVAMRKKLGEDKQLVSFASLPTETYVFLMTSLYQDKVQTYLDSDEFKAVPGDDKLVSLVLKIMELGLPLNSENLGQIYSGLPQKLSRRVSKRDIKYVNLPLKTLQELREALSDERIRTYLDSDEFKAIPFEDRLVSLVLKIMELGLELHSENLGQIYSGLPQKLSSKVSKKDIKKVALPLKTLQELRKALLDDRIGTYLDSDEFKDVPGDYKLVSLVVKIMELGLELNSENLGQIYSGLPQKLSSRVSKKDIRQVNLPLNTLQELREALLDDRIRTYLDSDEFKDVPGDDRLVSLVLKIMELDLELHSENLGQIYSGLPQKLSSKVSKKDIKRVNLTLKTLQELREALLDDRISAYLDSDEFKSVPDDDKLVSLVLKIMELDLELHSENLAQIYSGLPQKLSRRVSKRDIKYVNLPLKTLQELREALSDDGIRRYLDSDEFKTLPGEDKLVSLVLKIMELDLELHSENLGQIYSGLPQKLSSRISKKDIKYVDLPLKTLQELREALSDERIRTYLDSDEFRSVPGDDKLVSLILKIMELDLLLNSENLTHIYSGLPQKLSSKVSKKDIKRVELPLRVFIRLRDALEDERVKFYLASEEFLSIPKANRLKALIIYIKDVGFDIGTLSSSGIYSGLPGMLYGTPTRDLLAFPRGLPVEADTGIVGAMHEEAFGLKASDRVFAAIESARVFAMGEINETDKKKWRKIVKGFEGVSGPFDEWSFHWVNKTLKEILEEYVLNDLYSEAQKFISRLDELPSPIRDELFKMISGQLRDMMTLEHGVSHKMSFKGLAGFIYAFAERYGRDISRRPVLDRVYQSIFAAHIMKGDHDLGIGIANGGIATTAIFSLAGLDTALADVHTRKGKDKFAWLGEGGEKTDEDIMRKRVKGKRILVIDDDVISGGTLDLMVRELKKFGPKSIDVIFKIRHDDDEKLVPDDVLNIYFANDLSSLNFKGRKSFSGLCEAGFINGFFESLKMFEESLEKRSLCSEVPQGGGIGSLMGKIRGDDGKVLKGGFLSREIIGTDGTKFLEISHSGRKTLGAVKVGLGSPREEKTVEKVKDFIIRALNSRSGHIGHGHDKDLKKLIENKLKKINKIFPLHYHKDVMGFFGEGVLYVNEDLIGDEMSLIHELGESLAQEFIGVLQNKNEDILGIEHLNMHTYMRGVGKDVRLAYGRLETEKRSGGDAEDLIDAINAKMAEETKEGRLKRYELTSSERALIRLNFKNRVAGSPVVMLTDPNLDLLYGFQDRIDPDGNVRLSKHIRYLLEDMNRGVHNTFIIPGGPIESRSVQQSGGNGAARKLERGYGTNTTILRFENDRQLKQQIDRAIIMDSTENKFLHKIKVNCQSEIQRKNIVEYISTKYREYKDLFVVTYEENRGYAIDEVKMIMVGSALLNDHRLSVDLRLPIEELKESRYTMIKAFIDSGIITLEDGEKENLETSGGLDAIMREIYEGIRPLHINPVDWNKLRDFHDSMQLILQSV